jgi:NADH-quinone oxidoreductase subunit E
LSVRRLSPNQPASFAFTPESKAKAEWWISKFPAARKQSAVIPLLWLVQKQEGWVCEPAIRAVAEMLGMAQIRVLEVVTFYTMFMLEPVGSVALVQVCGTTPCMLRGSGDLMAVCKKKIGAKEHLSADGKFYWQEVECMGACSNAPMAAINDYYYEDLTGEALEKILDDFAAGKAPPPGSAIGRTGSAPDGGALTLSDPSLFDGSRSKAVKKLPNAAPKPKAKSEPAA